MLTEQEKYSATLVWALTCSRLPTEKLLQMYAEAQLHLSNDPEAVKNGLAYMRQNGAPRETAESLRAKAEFTLELIKTTLAERGVNPEVLH